MMCSQRTYAQRRLPHRLKVRLAWNINSDWSCDKCKRSTPSAIVYAQIVGNTSPPAAFDLTDKADVLCIECFRSTTPREFAARWIANRMLKIS